VSDYSKSYDGAAKDAAQSTITGADFDTEFDAIEAAIATKSNKIIGATNGNLIEQDANGDLVDSGIAAASFSFRGCLVARASALTVLTSTDTPVTFATTDEDYDTDNIHEGVTNLSRLTVPSGVTKVRLNIQVLLGSESGGRCDASVWKNGSATHYDGKILQVHGFEVAEQVSISGGGNIMSVSGGDYFELVLWQNSGSSNSVSGLGLTWFAMEIIE